MKARLLVAVALLLTAFLLSPARADYKADFQKMVAKVSETCLQGSGIELTITVRGDIELKKGGRVVAGANLLLTPSNELRETLGTVTTDNKIKDCLASSLKIVETQLKLLGGLSSAFENVANIGPTNAAVLARSSLAQAARITPKPPVPETSAITSDPVAAMRALGAAVKALPTGDIVLDAPKAMKVGDKRKVDAIVGKDLPTEFIRRNHRPGDQEIKGKAHLSLEMVATLDSPAFKVEPIKSERQFVAEGIPTVWSWFVEAKDPGEQRLDFVLYAIVGDAREQVASFEQDIEVSVRPMTWGEWLTSAKDDIDAVKAIALSLAALTTAALGWFGISKARDSKKKRQKTETETVEENELVE